MLQPLPHWPGSTAIMTTIILIITVHMMIHLIQHQHTIIHLLASFLYHSYVLLFYDYAIMILTIPMTHMFSYLSLTLPGLNLDLHSFDYPFLSCLCPILFSPPHSLCNCSIFTYDVLSLELLSVMATLVYIV